MLHSLHREAVEVLGSATEKSEESTDMAVLLNAAHCYNLYESLLQLVVGGRFDVAVYLVRPLWDSAALLGATGSSETAALRFLSDHLKASDARKMIVAEVGRSNAETARKLDAKYQSDSKDIQRSAHASALQADKLLSGSDAELIVNLVGRADVRQARFLMRAALSCELDVHTRLFAARGRVLGQSWHERSDEVVLRVVDWITGASAETEAH